MRVRLRDVMLQGVDKDIVVLPVHDAVAVQQKHEELAVDTMLEAWHRVSASGGSAKARIKIDRPHPVKSKLDQLCMLK